MFVCALIGCQLLPKFEGPLVVPEHYNWERLALRNFTRIS
jgi:hypothetical protein